MGRAKGDQAAAIHAFEGLARDAADSLANAVTLFDGLVVIGGGLSGAYPIFLPKLVEEMTIPSTPCRALPFERMEVVAYNLRMQ